MHVTLNFFGWTPRPPAELEKWDEILNRLETIEMNQQQALETINRVADTLVKVQEEFTAAMHKAAEQQVDLPPEFDSALSRLTSIVGALDDLNPDALSVPDSAAEATAAGTGEPSGADPAAASDPTASV